MRITSGVDYKERSVKVTEYVSAEEWIIRKVVLNVYTSGVDHKEKLC